ncbi:MAG: cytochrome P450 [Tepidiforma sp.]
MVFFRPERPGYGDDPYPELARLRAAEPVHWSANLGAWVVTGYDACEQALLDAERFGADPALEAGPAGERVAAHRQAMPFGEAAVLGHADGAEHARLRGAVSRAFGARAIAGRETDIRGLIGELAGRGSSRAPFELMGGLARPLAAMTALRHFGIDPARWEGFHGAALAVMRARVDGLDDPAAAPAAAAAGSFILEALADAAEDGEEGTVAAELAGAIDRGEVSAAEAVMLLVHIGLAGNGPTAMALGTAAWALAHHPRELARFLGGEVTAGEVLEEALRWDSPAHSVPRFAREDAELGGRRIRRGQRLLVMVAAANRDPARFEEPDRFLPGRGGPRHLSFGVGPHYCLGAPLARAELAIALEELARRFGAFRVAEGRRGGTLQVRGFERLVIVPGAQDEREG